MRSLAILILLAAFFESGVRAGGAYIFDLRIGKATGEQQGLLLDWTACHPGPGVTGYSVYEGTMRDFDSHLPVACSTGTSSKYVHGSPAREDAYYLVVQSEDSQEGSYGASTSGQRLPSVAACGPQVIGECVVEDLGRCAIFFDPPVSGWWIVPSPGSGFQLIDPCTGEIYLDTDPGPGDGRIDDCDCDTF